jgi:hypothetical protein
MMILLITSCTKTELKKPTEIKFGFKANSNVESGFHFTQGSVNVCHITIEGNRIEGDDIYFNRPFDTPIETDLNGSSEIQEFRFDIPQGEYNQLSFSFLLKESNEMPSINLKGMYHSDTNPPVSVSFQLDNDQYFDLVVSAKEQNQVILNHEQSRTGDVIFNLDYWFGAITHSMMENATIENINGLEHVAISSVQNVNIYNVVLNRINQTDEVILN